MLALAPQTRNKFKAGFRPGRLREMKSKHAIGRAASSPGNEFVQSAGAIVRNKIKASNRPGRLHPRELLCLCGRGATLTETPTITVRSSKNPDRIRVSEKRKFNRKNIFIPGRKYFHFPMYQTKKCL